MPELLSDPVKQQIKDVFQRLPNAVEIVYFGTDQACEYCEETLQLLQEVAALSDKLGLTVFNLEKNPVEAKQYKIDKAPGFSIMAKVGEDLVDYGIHFYGIPFGNEFTSLINDLVLVSERNPHLDAETTHYLKGLKTPVHLQIFTTPT